MAANWNGNHLCEHPRVAPNGTEYCGCAHEPTMRELVDIEREPVFTAPPDPLAELRANVVKHIPVLYQRMAIAWIELAFVIGGNDALRRHLARMESK